MIITPLLQLAADKQASDLFFSVGAPVSIKIDGIAMPVNAQILYAEVIRRIACEIMSPKRIAEFNAKLEMNFSFRTDGIGNFRVNIFRQRGDIAIVIRYVKGKIENVENLNLPGVLKELIMERRGRIRKIHYACLDDRAPQQHQERPYPDHRRPGRIHLQARQVHRKPARNRHRHPTPTRMRCPAGCARPRTY